MKPPPFEYCRASTLGEAVAVLSDGDSKVLAGGQSLVIDLNRRRTRPARLVDINRVAELDLLRIEEDRLRVGALVRHATFEHAVEPGPLGRLLAEVSRTIAHPPIRTRGTMVGSLAYAHPAAEWCTVAAALDAELHLAGTRGQRVVAASEFFRGPFRTACSPDEIVTEVRFPLLDPDTGVGSARQNRTAASFPMVAAVTALTVRDGVIDQARIGVTNAADRPLRPAAAERSMIGEPPSARLFAFAGQMAADEADPKPEPYCGIEYRRHAVAVLVRRALERAAGERGDDP